MRKASNVLKCLSTVLLIMYAWYFGYIHEIIDDQNFKREVDRQLFFSYREYLLHLETITSIQSDHIIQLEKMIKDADRIANNLTVSLEADKILMNSLQQNKNNEMIKSAEGETVKSYKLLPSSSIYCYGKSQYDRYVEIF
jgi:recombinational DNA repair protein (RecF pathway)